MASPLVALASFFFVLALVVFAFWPRRGMVARVRRALRSTERVLLEDALKHVYTCESVGQSCTLESVAGRLEVSTGRAAALVARLVEMDLVRSSALGAELTEEGRRSALRLVRTHRLWERYLADRTNVPPAQWHEEAEDKEHTLTPDEADRLAARLGHPRWDPHGDPIPTAAGELPPSASESTLADASPGTAWRVVHLEDEPREIYEQLLGEGLAPGSLLEVVERSPKAVRVRAAGREWELPSLAARHVDVRPLEQGRDPTRSVETLRNLRPGEVGVVRELSPACRGAQRRRLLDLGVVRGTRIRAELDSAFGDPVAYRIRGALIALRASQAEWVRIERAETDTDRGAA